MAPPTFHLGYGLAVNLVGELLVVVTETTGIDLPTAGRLKGKGWECAYVHMYVLMCVNVWYFNRVTKFITHQFE